MKSFIPAYKTVITILTGLVLFSCCEREEDGGGPGRVLLVYMGGDEFKIQRDVADKLNALVEGAKKSRGNIIIYTDRYGSEPALEEIRIGKNGASLETIETYGKENSASADIFRRSVDYIKERFPGRKYGLLVFSHASGWLPAGTLQKPLTGLVRSIVIDDGGQYPPTDRDEMEMSGFAAAIPDGFFDYIVFETCLTSNVEVAYELRNKTAYILASSAEIVSPGFTPVYPRTVKFLLDTDNPLADNLTAFAREYIALAKTDSRYYDSATASVIGTAGMEDLATAVREINSAAEGGIEDLNSLQRFDRPGQYGDSPALAKFFDLEEYIEGIASSPQFDSFREKLGRVVIWKDASSAFLPDYGGFAINRHCGLTTYIERSELTFINEKYRETSWYRDTN